MVYRAKIRAKPDVCRTRALKARFHVFPMAL